MTCAPDDHGFEYVEHLNDLALECRESNLRKSTTLNGNNVHMNRLKHAFWVEGVKGAARKAEEIEQSQESYWSCLLYTSPSPRDATLSRMPSSA